MLDLRHALQPMRRDQEADEHRNDVPVRTGDQPPFTMLSSQLFDSRKRRARGVRTSVAAAWPSTPSFRRTPGSELS